MSWARVAGIGSAVVLSVVAAAGMRLWSVDLQQAFAGAALEVRQATGLEVAMAGEFSLDMSWPPRAVGNNLTIANAAWPSRPPLAIVQSVEAELDPLSLLAGAVQVKRILLTGVDLRLERTRDGRTNWALEPVEERRALPAEWTDITSSLTDLVIEKGQLAFIDHATRRERTISVERVITHAENDEQPVEIDADVRINAASVALAGTIGSVREIRGGLPFAIDLRAAGAGATIAINGQIAWPVDGQAPAVALATTIEGADLGELGPLIGAPLPSVGPYDLSTLLGTDATGYRLSALKLRLGNSDIAGEVFVDPQEGKQRLVATLTSTSVDLADLNLAAVGDTTAPVFDAGRMLPEQSSRFGMPAIADAQIKFTGARVVGGAFELDRVTADVILRDDRLTVDPFDAREDAMTPHVMDGMGGTVHLAAETGSIDAGLAQRLLADQAALLVAETGDEIEFNCMAGRLTLAEGVPMAAAAVINAADASITGIGQVDLRAQTIDMRLTPSTTHPDLAGRLVSVIARGPLTRPEVLLEPLPAAGPGDQVAGLVSDATVAPNVTDAISGNACAARLDLAIGTNDAESMGVPATADVGQEAPGGAATQAAKKRPATRRFQGFFEALSDDLDALLGAAKSGRPTPISKNESRKLR